MKFLVMLLPGGPQADDTVKAMRDHLSKSHGCGIDVRREPAWIGMGFEYATFTKASQRVAVVTR